jgi:glycosyltransferase involved in cell wall biosynthesis
MSGTELVSVVVIGRNEGALLERCLASVSAMVCEGFSIETIYVDSGSSDDSVALAERMGATGVALQAKRPTAAMGRNAGWKIARGSIILFLDGDTVLDARFVLDSRSCFEDESVAVVWGHRRETRPLSSVYVRVMDLDWVYGPGWTTFCGGDALFRRDVLEAAGGFDETLIAGEEPELCRRILGMGKRILHVDRAMTGHDLGITKFPQYWRRAARAGYAYAEVSERFAGTDDPFWSADARRNRTRAIALLGLVAMGAVAALVMRNMLPIILGVAILAVLALRTAWKARWKSRDRMAVLLYGLHSHFQQVPIFVGQMQYRWNRRRGVRGELVEYKRG